MVLKIGQLIFDNAINKRLSMNIKNAPKFLITDIGQIEREMCIRDRPQTTPDKNLQRSSVCVKYPIVSPGHLSNQTQLEIFPNGL